MRRALIKTPDGKSGEKRLDIFDHRTQCMWVRRNRLKVGNTLILSTFGTAAGLMWGKLVLDYKEKFIRFYGENLSLKPLRRRVEAPRSKQTKQGDVDGWNVRLMKVQQRAVG